MDEDSDSQMNYCADLLTLKALEAFPFTLLRDHRSGEWVQVDKLCQASGIFGTEIKAELVTTWLPDPLGDQDYAVIIFFDDETKESLAANYNKAHLLGADSVGLPQG